VVEQRGEGWGYIWVIQDPAEGGVNVVFVQKYIAIQVLLSKTPDVNPMAQEGFSIVNCRVSLVANPGFGHLGICAASVTFEDRVGGIYDDLEFLFLHDQAQKRDRDAVDGLQEKAGEA
jgi:hypothetical protein